MARIKKPLHRSHAAHQKTHAATHKSPKEWRYAPLKGSFMVLAIVGFFTSAYLILPKSTNYGIAFMFLSILMFIASMISMTKAPIVE